MEARDARDMSYAEYVALERVADRKHEYVNGRVYATAGGSPEHARLAGAVIGALTSALAGKPCAPFSSDLRVRVAATGRSTYPDVTVICGRVEHAAEDDDAVTNPAVIVEVLSDSTESDDRGDKWAHYQRIPSLREYVLVSQRSKRIEVYSRDAEQHDLWHYRDHSEGARAALPSLDVTLSVDEIYESPLG
ncbi:MAG: Uma2 family endonuclease [Myxococcota bacterium]|nr:Uma2 family endonuclease [Myxococcota bacterium]